MGENGDSLCCDAVVKDVAVLSQEGAGEGERTLRAEVLLGLTVRATDQPGRMPDAGRVHHTGRSAGACDPARAARLEAPAGCTRRKAAK